MISNCRRIAVALAICGLFPLVLGCGGKAAAPSQSKPVQTAAPANQPAPPGAIELVFTYGSEKEKWITEATQAFNEGKVKNSRGKVIFVRATPMGSGECVDEALS